VNSAANPPVFRFSRSFRITTKAEYAAVFDEGHKLSQGWFLVLYKKNQKEYPRLGIIVSKRIIKKAPGRNYLKRLLRESFRVRKATMAGLDLVIMVRKGCKIDDKLRLHKELDTLWQRLSSV